MQLHAKTGLAISVTLWLVPWPAPGTALVLNAGFQNFTPGDVYLASALKATRKG